MQEITILLHGAGRSPRSWGRMAKALAQHGYHIHNLGYPSRRKPIEGLALNSRIWDEIGKINTEKRTKNNYIKVYYKG